jgi:hypothetical protein
MDKMHQKKRTQGHWILLGLFLFFIAPVLIVLYMYKIDFHPQGQSYGVLVKPIISIELPTSLMHVKSLDSSIENEALWHDKWSLVLIADQCTQECKQKLYDMRQIHASLEKDMNRLQRILITHQQDIGELHRTYPDLIIINSSLNDVDSLMKAFAKIGSSINDPQQIYMVDPLGNLMMRFPRLVRAKEIRHDIVKLLKYAWAG